MKGISESEKFIKVYGGMNTKMKPFVIGQKIKQRYTVDEDKNIIDGTGILKVVGYKLKDMIMVLKPLNESALFHEDTLNNKLLGNLKKINWNPDKNQNVELHYMYADRFEKIN